MRPHPELVQATWPPPEAPGAGVQATPELGLVGMKAGSAPS